MSIQISKNNMSKELLFTVTADDCDWSFFAAGGPGGQHQNKTASACRCTHRASGAVGISREHREQRRNKIAAFQRMSQTKEFGLWHKLEASRLMVTSEEHRRREAAIEVAVEQMMREENIKVQMKDASGKWVDYDESLVSVE